MKWPRRGILIRLAIYLPIIGYLSYQAFFAGEKEPEPPPAADQPTVRTLSGPDGKEFKVIEVTPEQAEAMGVKMPEKPAGEPAPEG
ncbi:MAG: hypothetical protein AAGA54_24120 [Myxococcota bacterium]